MRGVCKVHDEPRLPNEGGVFKIYDKPESTNEGACLRYMMHRNRQTRDLFKIYEEH